MSDFFTVDFQAQLYGWLNLFAVFTIAYVGFLAARLITRNRTLYLSIAITCFLACGFHLASFSFVLIRASESPYTPYIQLVRSIFFLAAFLSAIRTSRLLIDSDEP